MNMRLKKSIWPFACFALVTAACGDDDETTATDSGTDVTTDAGTGDTADAGEDAITDDATGDVEPDLEVDMGEPPSMSLLDRVQEADILNCGVSGQAIGFSEEDTGQWSGFDVDFCRAVAAAVLGDAEKVNYVALTSAERFEVLSSGSIDVLIRNTTWTQSRDSDLGADFGPTTFYDGQKLLGRSPAFANTSTIDDIDGATVCVIAGTTSELNIVESAREAGVTVTLETVDDFAEAVSNLLDDTCDLITTDESALVGVRVQLVDDGEGDFAIFPPQPMSKEPLGPVYDSDDSVWADVINWVVYAMIIADEKGITSANIDDTWDMDTESTALFGGENEGQTAMGLEADAFRDVIALVGNYDEVYEANLAALGFSRDGTPNASFDDGGLIYAPRAGGALSSDLGPATEGGTLETVETRGMLNCGVNAGATGFGVLDEVEETAVGFDVDFCRAIAAAVLGDADAVNYVPLTSGERFEALSDGRIDVLIRNTTWTQSRDVAFDFAPTTYYDGQKLMGRAGSGFSEDTELADLDGAVICVAAETTSAENIVSATTEAGVTVTIHDVEGNDAAALALIAGDCDLMTTDESSLIGIRVDLEPDDIDDLVIFPDAPISKEPLGPVYRANDSVWADVVNWTFFAMVIAAEKEITSENIDTMSDVDPEADRLFGGEGEFQTAMGLSADAYFDVIEQVGNYDEVFEDNLGPLGLTRAGTLNAPWEEGGLIYAPPAR